MIDEYYFSFEEPRLYDKDIKLAFCIDSVNKSNIFFFIVLENKRYVGYYSIIKSSEFIDFIRGFEKNSIEELFSSRVFISKYNDKFLKEISFSDQDYISKFIESINKDDVYNSEHYSCGLDGFSIQLKKGKTDKYFYSWCSNSSEKYFYILDFVNSILDEIGIDRKYRFIKNKM